MDNANNNNMSVEENLHEVEVGVEGAVANILAQQEPLDIFPEELWLDVFKRLGLDNPRDLIHAGEASPFFEDLLERGSPGVPGAGRNVCELVEVLPLILKWLGNKDILNLRKVCKRVSLTVDRLLEKNSQISPYSSLNLFPWLIAPLPLESPRRLDYESRNIKLPPTIFPSLVVHEVLKLKALTFEINKEDSKWEKIGRKMKLVGDTVRVDWAFEGDLIFNDRLDHMQPTVEDDSDVDVEKLFQEDPILDFKVKEPQESEEEETNEDSQNETSSEDDYDEQANLQDEEDAEIYAREFIQRLSYQRVFLDNCVQFFNHFPEKIRFLNISVDMVADSFKETYNFLRQVISALPNLNCLNFNSGSLHRHPETLKDVTDFNIFIDGHPLPPAPKLEGIVIGYYFFPDALLREICERYGNHLKELKMGVNNGYEGMLYSAPRLASVEHSSYDFQVLEQLSLVTFFENSSTLMMVDAPLLKSLDANNVLEYESYLKKAGVKQLIAVIMKFPLVIDLKLDLNNVQVPTGENALEQLEGENVEQKNVERLRIIHLEVSNIPLAFFTRLCPNLEFITVLDNGGWTRNRELRMMRARCMKKSGIWEEAPNLKKIKHVKFELESPCLVYECTRP